MNTIFPFFRIIVSGRLPTPITLSFGTDGHLKEIKFFKIFFLCSSSEKVAECNRPFEIITYKRHRLHVAAPTQTRAQAQFAV